MTAPAAPPAARPSRAGSLLVDCLIEQGADRVFTVPGESFLAVLDALHDCPQIETVTCRHEGGAAYMACADGAMTGRPGLCMVTRGPGATNASIGVHVAMQDSVPMILFVGDVDRPMRDREAFQEVDLVAMFAPLAKWAARIDDARRIPEYVARAYSVAIAGRPGPVVLALPHDMLLDAAPGAVPRPAVVRPAQAPCPDAVGTLMRLLEDAAAPLAIVGGADWNLGARQSFQLFAEHIGLPVAAAFRRQDAIANSSPVWAGPLGFGASPDLLQRVKEADLLLVVGARLGEVTSDGYALVTPDHPGQLLVHVHPDPEELGQVYRTDLAMCADMAEFAEAAALLHDDIVPFDAGADAHREWQDWSTPRATGAGSASAPALDLALCVGTMRDCLPPDTLICNGAGNFSSWWHRYWHYESYPGQLAPTAGAMGYGLPAAIAAAKRYPDRMVVALAGDGDFLMNGQELATAAQYDCNLIVLVVDNASYGTIRMHQERMFPGRVSATTLTNPDFVTLARAFGHWGERVETTAQFTAALAEAKGRRGVRLLHLVTDIEQLSATGLTLSDLHAKH
ncbi:MAG: thiamine pyrophosphate-dependent enzyme [Pseudomonadota bacterium]